MIALTKILGPWVKKEGQKKLFKVKETIRGGGNGFLLCDYISIRKLYT